MIGGKENAGVSLLMNFCKSKLKLSLIISYAIKNETKELTSLQRFDLTSSKPLILRLI